MGRSDDRPILLFFVLLAATFSGALASCALESERVAPYQGRITLTTDSSALDTVGVDISLHGGMVIYDRESDGQFDDTAYFEGDSEGYFGGVLFYTVSATVRAPWVQKPMRIIVAEWNIDTFVTVQAHLKSHELEIDVSDIGLIFAEPESLDSASANRASDTLNTPEK